LFSVDILQTRGLFRCVRPHFLAQKNFGFFEIYGVSTRTREEEVEPVQTFSGQGGSIFRDFVQISFIDGP